MPGPGPNRACPACLGWVWVWVWPPCLAGHVCAAAGCAVCCVPVTGLWGRGSRGGRHIPGCCRCCPGPRTSPAPSAHPPCSISPGSRYSSAITGHPYSPPTLHPLTHTQTAPCRHVHSKYALLHTHTMYRHPPAARPAPPHSGPCFSRTPGQRGAAVLYYMSFVAISLDHCMWLQVKSLLAGTIVLPGPQVRRGGAGRGGEIKRHHTTTTPPRCASLRGSTVHGHAHATRAPGFMPTPPYAHLPAAFPHTQP